MSERIAVYGGSFDPPHIAHVLVAAWALSMGEVDRVLVLPTLAHALGKSAGASFEQRVSMCERAFAALPGASVDTLERELGAPSRTLHTLEALRRRHPSASFRLVIGSDILRETHRWFRWEDVASLAPPLVVGRAGYVTDDEASLVMPEVSSSRIRAALLEGESVDSWVPAEVRAFIGAHGLYGAESP
ncbi:MAG: nicotinate (nicotinamide) nucleotide adenylyltransferase [Polyangiales bacterium]|nr:nicotinate (nicotinamide) nucleotide adenylyltransferase [Myxococcales bacterium]MCB9657985.1 nicotinate (nicotinamide) nucleotide adenylyltransferase [Sandaracinaceae bacterium]